MDNPTLKATLSPSRIADFTGCPLKFRYRTIDRLPERPSPEALRGTVVHKVLEDLFDLPREQRTEAFAVADLLRAFRAVVEEDPNARFAIDATLVWPDDPRPAAAAAEESFLASLPPFIERYFVVERPESFDATHREHYVRGRLDDDLWMHGYVDRIDVAPTGEVRIIDYKTGRAPSAAYQDKALFQLKVYALLWEQEHDVRVRMLLMLYLGSAERLLHHPQATDNERVREQVRRVWSDMKQANARATWQPRTSRLCDWCSFQALCPAKGGTALPIEPVAIEVPS